MAEPPGDRILVTGALGQIGTELVSSLRESYGKDNVIATDIRVPDEESSFPDGPFSNLSVLDGTGMEKIIQEEGIGTVYHLAAILSATGEKDPELCQRVNVGGTVCVLEAARDFELKVFAPSSIAVFGPDSPDISLQSSPLNPTTMYGKTKVTGEILGLNYWKQYGVDVRGLRFPGLISWKAPAGGGTTDYAVDIFRAAIEFGHYECFVSEDTRLPMMYMDDAIRATERIMEADLESLGDSRAGYNIKGISFTAGELADKIAERIPEFTCDFIPDFRQKVADSWPNDVDDQPARDDWGWKADYDLGRMVDEMISNIS
ncbi:MAG TPA: NAD-dependent epimerase/dehydratase family protein [Candidatus Poseidoniales archaeon]|jgi:nucleoside-diphosphate-sugar epimerase|nr:MAG TPA: NAD-dependent epimerase/dehydratase family protein [Candidatus Poseidoniales archaeon]HII25747.1 NAD-dependent epimerase/dehydratase family protein [Candidatus Thalassarchaeaceae archaeon]|tara:strand:- start:105 stop:1055 length:951 start_codon:yes stop_codon:yes gene_type:complete